VQCDDYTCGIRKLRFETIQSRWSSRSQYIAQYIKKESDFPKKMEASDQMLGEELWKFLPIK
jgi:hypothetical protein